MLPIRPKGPLHYIDHDESRWIDNRWLATHVGFLDTDTMKVALMPTDDPDDRPTTYFATNSRTALFHDALKGTYLAKVVGP